MIKSFFFKNFLKIFLDVNPTFQESGEDILDHFSSKYEPICADRSLQFVLARCGRPFKTWNFSCVSVSEWDEQRWGQWFENQGLSEFVMEGRPAFMKMSDAFNSKDNNRLDNVIKTLRTWTNDKNISNEKADVAESYLRDIFEP